MTRSKTPMLLIAGAFLLWVLTLTLQAMAGSGPDRSAAIQGPLALLILGGPLLSWVLRARRERLRWPLLAAQFGCYVLYETGISVDTNIRSDLILLYPAILLTAWILFRTPRPPGDPAVQLPASVRIAAILALLVALAGVLGSAFQLGAPFLIAGDTAVSVPPWFRPYCLGTGGAGLAASCVLLWGAWRLLRSAQRGPAIFMLGAILFMLVTACFAVAGLVSSAPFVRANLVPAIGLLAVTGTLLFLVRRAPLRASVGDG